MDKFLVTIAIPIYNAESFLRDAILSVINQTYRGWYLYLINDGSTDASVSIMQEFAAQDSRIKIIDDGQNKGLVARLNQSIVLAETKYYARMDADDIMYITRIEEQISFLEEHSKIDVLGTSIMTIDNENNIIGSGFMSGKVDGFIHPTVMGRTEWFKNNPYSEEMVRAEDFELWIRTSNKSCFYALGNPLLFYREFGVPTLKKTLQSLRTTIKVYCNYKYYNKPLIWCLKNVMITILKMVVYSFFSLFGLTDYIVRMRNRKSIPLEKCLTKKDLLDSIKSCSK